MSVSAHRLRKPVLALSAVAALALVLSACAFYKPGSLQVSQPGEIGSVRIHMAFCTALKEGNCVTASENEQGQTYLAIAVPAGTTAPETIVAVAEPPSAPPLVFRRNQGAADALAGVKKKENDDPPWPPAGSEIVGYMSDLLPRQDGENVEWTIDPEFGLPVPADGGPYGGAFLVALAIGQREADGASASRPAECPKDAEEEKNKFIECEIVKEARVELRPTDLRVKSEGAAPTVTAGQEATVPFKLEVGTTASTVPAFSLGATSNLPGATASVADGTYKPDAPTDASHRASASRNVKVSIPASAKAGTYSVTLTAKTAAGATVAQTSSFNVNAAPVPKASLKLGKPTLNKARGTATIAVQVSSAGTLTVSGRKVAGGGAKASGPQTIKVSIRAKGKAKKKLNKNGKVAVKATLAFTPTVGAAVSQVRSLTLKKNLSQ